MRHVTPHPTIARTTRVAESVTTSQPAVRDALARLSVRDLIAELARVEESLRATPALIARRHGLLPNPARRPLLRRERALVEELAARRDQRGRLGA